MIHPSARPLKLLAAILLLTLAGWHGWTATRNWHIPGMSGHEFRQAQTAVTIQAMKEDGFRIDYSTPIMGKPWAIPFEFPLYQGLASTLSTTTGLSVVESGRWVSLGAFYLGLPAWVLLLIRSGFSPLGAVLGVVPLLFAPVYILYSRSVLIESTAWCAAAWFLCFLFHYRQDRRPWLLAATLLCGIVAVLVKSTTWAVACVPWAVWVVQDVWRERRAPGVAWRSISRDGLLLGGPLLAVGFGWVWITDRIKELNPIGAFLTSNNLADFNFGTLAQRADPAIWKALVANWEAAVMPWWTMVIAGVAAVLAPSRGRWIFGLGALVFIVGQSVFINLYAIHNYYFYANAAGLILGAGAVVAAFWDAPRAWYRSKLPAVALVITLCGSEWFAYTRDFRGVQLAHNGGTSGLTDAIKRLTTPNEVIVVHSPDWSSMLAFRSERRMLMVPDSQMFFRPDAVRQNVSLLQDGSVPLVIFRGESRTHVDWLLERIRDFGLELFPLFEWQGDATVYATRTRYRAMREILERENFSGVNLSATGNQPPAGPVVDIAGLAGADEILTMEPMPTTGRLPYGVGFRYFDGKKLFFAHTPTDLFFKIPEGATRLELGYRMEPSVYNHKEFDGVYLLVEVMEDGRAPRSIYQEWMTPDGSQKPRYVNATLGEHREATLAVRFLPGPANNNAYDWALLEYLRIR